MDLGVISSLNIKKLLTRFETRNGPSGTKNSIFQNDISFFFSLDNMPIILINRYLADLQRVDVSIRRICKGDPIQRAEIVKNSGSKKRKMRKNPSKGNLRISILRDIRIHRISSCSKFMSDIPT